MLTVNNSLFITLLTFIMYTLLLYFFISFNVNTEAGASLPKGDLHQGKSALIISGYCKAVTGRKI